MSGFPLEDYKNKARDNRHKLNVESSSWILNKKTIHKNYNESSKVFEQMSQKGCEISIWEQLAFVGL